MCIQIYFKLDSPQGSIVEVNGKKEVIAYKNRGDITTFRRVKDAINGDRIAESTYTGQDAPKNMRRHEITCYLGINNKDFPTGQQILMERGLWQ